MADVRFYAGGSVDNTPNVAPRTRQYPSTDSNGYTGYKNPGYETSDSAYSRHNGYTQHRDSESASQVSYSSSHQYLDVRRQPLNDSGRDRMGSNYSADTESGVYSHRAQSIASSDISDLRSVDSRESRDSRDTSVSSYVGANIINGNYEGEIYKPRAAPRSVLPGQAKKMFGEIHPRLLRPEEMPRVDSSDEIDDSVSVASTTPSLPPTAAPRASMRARRNQTKISFIEDEAIEAENALLRSILRKVHSVPANMGSKKIVRFEHVTSRREKTNKRDNTDYSAVDNQKKNKDIWSHVAPVGVKPARNDPKNRSGSRQRSSSQDRGRKSSRDRAGSHSRSQSLNSRSGRSNSRDRSRDRGSVTSTVAPNGRAQSQERSGSVPKNEVRSEDEVKITVSTSLMPSKQAEVRCS